MKRWRRLKISLLGASLLGWVICALAGEPVRETRDVSQPFNEVRLQGGVDLELTQSDTVSLVIEAAREDLPHIRSDIVDGVLTLRQEEFGPLPVFGWFSRRQTPRAFLSAKAIDRLVVEGDGDIHAGSWTAQALEVRISGAGAAKFDRLSAVRLSCDVAGSGHVVLAGSVSNQRIRISGSGGYRAADLESQTASVSISGSGNAELWVERKLNARIAGSGNVRYYGTPTLTQSVSGSGSLTTLGAKGPLKPD